MAAGGEGGKRDKRRKRNRITQKRGKTRISKRTLRKRLNRS